MRLCTNYEDMNNDVLHYKTTQTYPADAMKSAKCRLREKKKKIFIWVK